MSDLIGWIYPAGVVVGWFVLPVLFTNATAAEFDDLPVSFMDRAFMSLLGFIAAFLWPIALVAVPAYLLTGRSSAVRRQNLREREAEVGAREARIARLERELGVDR